MKELDIKWLQEYAEQEKRYKWGKQIKILLTAYEEKCKELKKEIQDDLDVRNRWGLTLQELEKEKEKNKKINKYIEDRAKIGKNIQTFINKDYVEQEYISKDKVEELLDRFDLEEELQDEYDNFLGSCAAIKILKQLLEEE